MIKIPRMAHRTIRHFHVSAECHDAERYLVIGYGDGGPHYEKMDVTKIRLRMFTAAGEASHTYYLHSRPNDLLSQAGDLINIALDDWCGQARLGFSLRNAAQRRDDPTTWRAYCQARRLWPQLSRNQLIVLLSRLSSRSGAFFRRVS